MCSQYKLRFEGHRTYSVVLVLDPLGSCEIWDSVCTIFGHMIHCFDLNHCVLLSALTPSPLSTLYDICLFSNPSCHALLDSGMKTCLYLSGVLGSPLEILNVQTTRLNQALWKDSDWCNLHWSKSNAWFWSVSSGFDWELLMWPQKPVVSKLIKLKVSFNYTVIIVTELQFLFFNQKTCEAFS